jgi:hypothetical protein
MQNKCAISGSYIQALFEERLPGAMIERVVSEHGPWARRPRRLSAAQLIQSLVFHCVGQQGNLSEHVRQLTGQAISDSALEHSIPSQRHGAAARKDPREPHHREKQSLAGRNAVNGESQSLRFQWA